MVNKAEADEIFRPGWRYHSCDLPARPILSGLKDLTSRKSDKFPKSIPMQSDAFPYGILTFPIVRDELPLITPCSTRD